MTSSELRLKNLVVHTRTGQIMAVHHLMPDACFLRYMTGEKEGALGYFHFTSIEPLPLTLNIIDAFGFKRNGRFAVLDKPYFAIEADLSEKKWDWVDKANGEKYPVSSFLYAHQLQNFYNSAFHSSLVFDFSLVT